MNLKTSIILLTYNHIDLTKDCIESIRKFTKKGTYELIVVDNASTDETVSYLKEQKDIKLILNKENKGFPIGCNQGIEASDPTSDILLLNNDTVVTTNWLTNLKTCLYSNPFIGAVGAVSNHTENRQGVEFTYETMEEMQQKAKENNESNPARWEEKAFLIGFCLLLKREVFNQIGLLDINYTPGYIEDNDLSLRILESGYKLMLCHDVFIHHYLGTSFRKDLNTFYSILFKNREYFYQKWHFDTFVFDEVKSASFPLMEKYKTILDLDASIGVNILELKYRYKDCLIEGVEKNKQKRTFAKKFASIYPNLKKAKTYDCILIGKALEWVKNPIAFLKTIQKHLNKNGTIIGEFENACSFKRIEALLNGKSTFTKNTFTKQELTHILQKTGFQTVFFYSWYENVEDKTMKALEKEYSEIQYTYYTFRTTFHG